MWMTTGVCDRLACLTTRLSFISATDDADNKATLVVNNTFAVGTSSGAMAMHAAHMAARATTCMATRMTCFSAVHNVVRSVKNERPGGRVQKAARLHVT